MKFMLIALIFLSILFLGCQKRSFDVELPENIALHSHELYLNGERNTDFEPEFIVRRADLESGFADLGFRFEKDNNDQGFSVAVFSFTSMPIMEGLIGLSDEFDIHDELAAARFGLGIGEDTPGDEYKPIRLDDGFMEVVKYDFAKNIVICRFKANFRRTRIRTNNKVFPKYLEFEGIFHDTMTVW